MNGGGSTPVKRSSRVGPPEARFAGGDTPRTSARAQVGATSSLNRSPSPGRRGHARVSHLKLQRATGKGGNEWPAPAPGALPFVCTEALSAGHAEPGEVPDPGGTRRQRQLPPLSSRWGRPCCTFGPAPTYRYANLRACIGEPAPFRTPTTRARSSPPSASPSRDAGRAWRSTPRAPAPRTGSFGRSPRR